VSSGGHYVGLIDRYRARLPVTDETRIVSLSEGNTPLIELQNLSNDVARECQIYVKFEGLNPTGSFKDRGMTMAVTQALSEGAEAIICASTGNTSASAAAYAARAGMRSFVLIPDGKIALGKLAQAMIQGAVVMQIQGNFDDGMRIVKEMAHAAPVTIVNSINPYRLQGQKTAAFEIVDALGRAPDYHCIPVGNAGNISAYWTGFSEYAGVKPATAACAYCDTDCVFDFAQSCSVTRRLARRHLSPAAWSMIRKPSLRQSASDGRNRGIWRGPRVANRVAGSIVSLTLRFSRHKNFWPQAKGCSANLLLQSRWPVRWLISRPARFLQGALSPALSLATV